MTSTSPLHDFRSTAAAFGATFIVGTCFFETPIPSGFEDFGLARISFNELTGGYALHFHQMANGNRILTLLSRARGSPAFVTTRQPTETPPRPVFRVSFIEVSPQIKGGYVDYVPEFFQGAGQRLPACVEVADLRDGSVFSEFMFGKQQGLEFSRTGVMGNPKEPIRTTKEEALSAAESALRIFRGFTATVNENSFPWCVHSDLREALLAARKELHPQMSDAPQVVGQQPEHSHSPHALYNGYVAL